MCFHWDFGFLFDLCTRLFNFGLSVAVADFVIFILLLLQFALGPFLLILSHLIHTQLACVQTVYFGLKKKSIIVVVVYIARSK